MDSLPNSTASSLSKLRQFRMQKKMPSVSHGDTHLFKSQTMTTENVDQYHSLLAGKDKDLYLVPDFPECDTVRDESASESFEVDKKPDFSGPQSFLQVILKDDENVKSRATEDSMCSQEIKQEPGVEISKPESTEVSLPVPLDQIKKELDFDECKTDETNEAFPLSTSEIKKELHIEIEENYNYNDNNNDDDNGNDADNNISNDDDDYYSDDEDLNKESIKRKREGVHGEVLKERERSLKLLMDKFPYSDIMEMQDILLFAEWNVQQAIAFIEENPIPLSTFGKGQYNAEFVNKKHKGKHSVNSGSEEDSQEKSSDGWLARANKETLKTYSKSISEKKVVHSNTKPIGYYGSKERARIKRQVENFILNQSKKQHVNNHNSQGDNEQDHSFEEIDIKIEND